ncbi:jg3924 [Pararge aegeria aegeria]|uniref:Jg3924 protein n=1 Tax=Pararge aegeria aegeria TaxID=348720 RepID=A0A8S4RV97_9NEOP|nr:jg3924 [Pararge aegeria aegeria]
MSDGRDSPSHSGLRDRVSFFERVWSRRNKTDAVDSTSVTTDVSEIERKIEQHKRQPESPKIDVKLKHTRDTQSPSKSYETSFPNLKLRHVDFEESETEKIEHQVDEGDLASGVRFVKFERVTVKRSLDHGRTLEGEDRPDSPQHEWYSEYKHHALHTAPRKDYLRSKSEYDSHIAEIRGKNEKSKFLQCARSPSQKPTP